MHARARTAWAWTAGLGLSVFMASAAEIRLPDNPAPVELTARDELAHYLAEGVKGEITLEGRPVVFHIGDSAVARAMGLEAAAMPDEAWAVKSSGSDIALVGGGTRGTLYAAYHFLEDVQGVRWWTPDEETVPVRERWELAPLDLSGRPFFRQRDIYRSFNNIIRDGGRFSARRRLNRDGDIPITPERGGNVAYGPPNFCHTFDHYFPKDRYFDKHPEYYALRDGKRVPGPQSQLCLTNPGMRAEMWELLKRFIAEGEKAAAEKGAPPPILYDFSGNDCRNPCQCEPCQAIAKREGSESGPLIDCLNEIAAKLKDHRPDLFLHTLAYYHTENPPRALRPAKNIVIRLADTSTNQAAPFSAPENRAFVRRLESWAKIAAHMGIWDYSITYMLPTGPFPHEYTLAESLRTYAANKVEYMFFEHEFADCADMYDLNIWLESRLMEDPNADDDALREEFYSGYYGAAGPLIAEYRRLLKESSDKKKTHIDWFASPKQFSMVDARLAVDAQALFDRAEAAMEGDPALLRRARRARLNLDRIIALNWRSIVTDFVAHGGTPETFPLDQQGVAARARDTRLAAIEERLQPEKREQFFQQTRKEFEAVSSLSYTPLRPPAFFKGKTYLDYTVEDAKLYGGHRISGDPDAESGVRVRVERDKELPLSSAQYVEALKHTSGGRAIQRDEVKGPGYNWYKIDEIIPRETGYMYILNDWTIQFPLDAAAAKTGGKRCEVWFSVKFEGPAYPHGKPGDKNAVSVERMALVVKD